MSIDQESMEAALAEAEQGWKDAELALAEANDGWAAAEKALAEAKHGWIEAERALTDANTRLAIAEKGILDAEQDAFENGYQQGLKRGCEITAKRDAEMRAASHKQGRMEGGGEAWMLTLCYVLFVVLPAAYLNDVFWSVAIWVIAGLADFFILFVMRDMRRERDQ